MKGEPEGMPELAQFAGDAADNIAENFRAAGCDVVVTITIGKGGHTRTTTAANCPRGLLAVHRKQAVAVEREALDDQTVVDAIRRSEGMPTRRDVQ